MDPFRSRRVGDITVVQCSGRIVEGPEGTALQQHLNAMLPFGACIVLNLADVHFVDSSGMGLLVRFLTRTRTAGGHLKLCAVPPKVAEVLRVTKLATVFESHVTEDDAIAAFYQPAKSGTDPFRFNADVLCVEKSTDVLAYVGELLRQAGYAVMTAGNLPDALTLLKVAKPKLVVISAELRSATGTRTAESFRALAEALSVVELPADFSGQDAGDAGRELVERVRASIAPRAMRL